MDLLFYNVFRNKLASRSCYLPEATVSTYSRGCVCLSGFRVPVAKFIAKKAGQLALAHRKLTRQTGCGYCFGTCISEPAQLGSKRIKATNQ